MTTKDLIPVRTYEEAAALGRKGGLAKSDKKTFAAKVSGIKRQMKNGNLKEEDAKWLLLRVEDNKSMALDILNMINSIRKETPIGKQTPLANVYNNIYKTIHGQKLELDVKVYHIVEDIDKFFDKKSGKIIDAEIVDERGEGEKCLRSI